MSKWIISISGPTAIGKTALGIAFAKAYNTHIISNDSRQVYKEMSIGTAVPTAKELAEAPHHFIQSKSIQDTFTAAVFEREALQLSEALFKTNEILIMVGGSMLYEEALLYGLHELPQIPAGVIDGVNRLKEKTGLQGLQAELKKKDPEYYEEVDIHNERRVVRALHLINTTSKTMKELFSVKKKKRSFNHIRINLTAEREVLYERINKRVDLMVTAGLEQEARSLLPYKNLRPLRTVGYQEWFDYFEGKYEHSEAVRLIKRNSRRFAKRQMTWYRKQDMLRFDYTTYPSKIVGQVDKLIKTQTGESKA